MQRESLTYYENAASELAGMLRQARLDHESFELRLKPCEMERCKGACCYDGVYVSEEEKGKVEGLVGANWDCFESYGLDLGQGTFEQAGERMRWKTKTRPASADEQAADFPKHFALTRCVFLDENSYCGLQRLAIDEGKHPWYYKPLTCWIHPVLIQSEYGQEALIRLVSSQNDPQSRKGFSGYASCTHCGREDSGGSLAHEVLAQELKGLGELAGRDFLAELTAPCVDYEELWKDV